MILGEMGDTGGVSGGSSEVGAASSIPIEESSGGGGGGGGSRWPRQQTLALLKIRSDMDPVFRDASLKAPLWEEVSRKMAELGFQRSAKKCREKFENVYKYHKRTKDGRASKPDGKTYRFFDQLEALEHINSNSLIHHPPPPPATNDSNPPRYAAASSLPTSPTPLSVLPPSSNPATFQQPPPPPVPISQPQPTNTHFKFSTNLLMETSSSSSTSSESDEDRKRGRKRKWKDYLQRLIRDVVEKQEEMLKRFLEALEKVERDRIAREEGWRVEEIARKNKEHDLLVQERSMAAAKDAALVSFLQKITTDPHLKLPLSLPLPLPALQVPPTPQPQHQQQQPEIRAPAARSIMDKNNVGSGTVSGSSSRWPKAEILALINLRMSLDLKYQDSGSKGPLWEDISTEMAKLGYNRSSKRCKQKWENINKYYKKVKESNKKRPKDSKTCPYFHQLEAIYKHRARNELLPSSSLNPNGNSFNSSSGLPNLMQQQNSVAMHDLGLNNHETDEEEDEEEEEEEEDDDEIEDEEGGGFEMIPPPPSTVTTTTTVE